MLFIRGALVWFALMALMFVNGAARELVTEAFVDAGTAEIVHVVLACLLIVTGAAVFLKAAPTTSFTSLLLLGVMWVLMTITSRWSSFSPGASP
jgi:hypothetical protein